MASNLRVDTILPSSGTNVAIGTASGTVSLIGDSNLSTSGNLTIGGNLGVGGVLTYEDVTNIDSVGLITARSGINISSGSLTIPDSIIHSGDTNTKIRFPEADAVTIETNGSERLRIASSGQIGLSGANYGTSGQVLTSQGNSSAPTWANAGGVTMLDTYYLTSNMSLTGGNWNDIKTNFTRLNGTDINRIRVTAIGTGLGVDNSGSASIFSFPSTGYYEIVFNAMFSMNNSSTSRYVYTSIKATNNNSNYNNAINNISSFKGYGNTTFHYATVSVILDITDISNDKFHLSLLPEINMDCNGNTGELATFMQVKRISDT